MVDKAETFIREYLLPELRRQIHHYEAGHPSSYDRGANPIAQGVAVGKDDVVALIESLEEEWAA